MHRHNVKLRKVSGDEGGEKMNRMSSVRKQKKKNWDVKK